MHAVQILKINTDKNNFDVTCHSKTVKFWYPVSINDVQLKRMKNV